MYLSYISPLTVEMIEFLIFLFFVFVVLGLILRGVKWYLKLIFHRPNFKKDEF